MKPTEKVHEVLARILTSFEQGTVPEALARTVIPTLDVPCGKWSLNNRLLTFFAGTADARGLRQWNEMGRKVIKGRKAFYILAPLLVKAKVDPPQEEPNQEEKTSAEHQEKRLTGFRLVPVFRVEDTEGEPLNYPPVEPPEPPPLADVAAAWGITLFYVPIQSSALGYYAPQKKEIVLCTHDEEVFFHELAHVAHEKTKGVLQAGQNWQQEVTAELTAATLMHLYGRAPNDGGAYRYIADYAQKADKDPHRACLAVIADVEQCLNQILAFAGGETNEPHLEQRPATQ